MKTGKFGLFHSAILPGCGAFKSKVCVREMRIHLHSTALYIYPCSCFHLVLNEISQNKTKKWRWSGNPPCTWSARFQVLGGSKFRLKVVHSRPQSSFFFHETARSEVENTKLSRKGHFLIS